MNERGDKNASGPAVAEQLEEALRRDNPKGRLLERCAKLRIEPPRVRHRAIGPRHQAEMTLEIGEWELSSGAQSGWSRRMAEQLAARELLSELEKLLAEGHGEARPASAPRSGDDDEDVWDVGLEHAERLRRENPKGRLFEWCQKQRPAIARPRFEARKVSGGGVRVRATLRTLHLSSPWFRASQVTAAEQAAAEALLPLLPEQGAEATSAAEILHPRAHLDQLRQRGTIVQYVIEVTTPDGPRARRFTATARATLPSGEVEVSETEGPSKREAALLAARALLDRVLGPR